MADTLSAIYDKIKGKIKNPDLVLTETRKTEAISSGSLLLDPIVGGGLLHKGRMTEVSGGESSGKTTLCLQSAVQALKKGKKVLFFDFEQSFHTDYAKALGLNLKDKNFMVFQPANLEEGVETIHLFEKHLPDDGDTVLIFDSVAAMKPQKLLDGAGGQQQIGLHAQRVGEFSSYLNSTWCGRKKAFILFTNQVRRIPQAGGMFQSKALKDQGLGFGASNDTSLTTTGGVQIRFMLSLRVMLDFAGKVEEGSYQDGNLIRSGNFIKAFTIKNKLIAPFRSVKLAILYGQGTSDDFAIINTLKDYEYITQGGAVFTYIDFEENEVGSGLSFKIKGKDEFYNKLKEPKYQQDMRKIFEYLMNNDEAVEIKSDNTTDEDITDEL